MNRLRTKHRLPTAPLAPGLRGAGGGTVDNPAFSTISRQRDRRFAKA